MTKNSARALYLLIALVVVLLDRWTKHMVAQRISLYSHIQIVPGFFRLTHTENTGAAFSLFADSPAPWKTALLISHRLSTVRMADQILVLNGGRIVEAGSHGDLMARGGHYASLYEMQASRYR